MSKTLSVYECDGCGACCSGRLVVEASPLDVLREPRILDADPRRFSLPILERVWLLACGKPCMFLGADNRCRIYASRPDDCVDFQAGCEKCQEARAAAGLVPLQPVQRPSDSILVQIAHAAMEVYP